MFGTVAALPTGRLDASIRQARDSWR